MKSRLAFRGFGLVTIPAGSFIYLLSSGWIIFEAKAKKS
jgi:hypothetical protein